jgi:ACS family glucarate transporter-like MFS transporter
MRFVPVAATFCLAVLLYVDRACISTAKEAITGELGLSELEFGWILSAFTLGYALFQTPCGMLADRFGPRRVLAAVVALWSLFTGLTGLASKWASMLCIRFLFGAGEAGAYPAMARAIYSWMPMAERGIAQGINFSGGRLGAAFAMPLVAWMVAEFGWRLSFGLLMAAGLAAALAWYLGFRDTPEEHPAVGVREREYIQAHRQRDEAGGAPAPLKANALLRSSTLWWAMAQYFAGNFTFFFCLSWLFPYLKSKYELEALEAGWYASAPLLAGAAGNILAGWLVDRLYRGGRWKLSRRLPAIAGFLLAAAGLAIGPAMQSPGAAVLALSLAIFGADMTLSPSWSLCIDIGRRHSGAVSGTMNMAGNLGSFATALAFPYLLEWTGRPEPFFLLAAALNLLACGAWLLINPEKPIEGA